MSSSWSPRRKVELGPSRYPARLRWLAVLVAWVALLFSALPLWGLVVLLVAVPLLVRGWQPPLLQMMELDNGVLTLYGRHHQVLEKPGRILRAGPWLALQTPKGWLHLFADQAPQSQLQPFYQWLWVKRVR